MYICMYVYVCMYVVVGGQWWLYFKICTSTSMLKDGSTIGGVSRVRVHLSEHCSLIVALLGDELRWLHAQLNCIHQGAEMEHAAVQIKFFLFFFSMDLTLGDVGFRGWIILSLIFQSVCLTVGIHEKPCSSGLNWRESHICICFLPFQVKWLIAKKPKTAIQTLNLLIGLIRNNE